MISPAVRGGWLFAHIALIFAGYAALFLSFGASLIYLLQERNLKSKRAGGVLALLPALETIDEISYRALLLGFPFMTLGLVAGVVVAQASYGQLDYLDPKILLSLVDVVGVFGDALYPLECGMAWSPRRLSGDRGICHRGRCLGGEFLQQHSPVCAVMTFHLIGVNHKTAPIDVRERLAIPDSRLEEALKSLVRHPGVEEGIILSTCNRVELLAQTRNGSADLRQFICDYFDLDPHKFVPHLYEYREHEAIRHLFRVASSLDSMVVGEPQILGQVKDAYATARAVGTVRSQLDLLLTRAFAVAKRVRTETAVGSSPCR